MTLSPSRDLLRRLVIPVTSGQPNEIAHLPRFVDEFALEVLFGRHVHRLGAGREDNQPREASIGRTSLRGR